MSRYCHTSTLTGVIHFQKNATCLTAVNRIGIDGKRYAGRAASELSESEDLKNEEGKLSDEDYEYTEGSFQKYGIPEDIQQKLKGITLWFVMAVDDKSNFCSSY